MYKSSMSKIFFSILVTIIFSYNCQAQSVSGTILTVDGSPASQVNVELYDLKMFTTTDENGHFIFKHVPDGKYTVIASYTGLETKRFPVEVNKKSVTTNIILTENSKQLDAVIIKSAKSLNEITTSAGKVAIKPMDLPQSIVVLGENVIKQQQSQRLSDVIKNVNGVYLGSTRGAVQESFFARGYNLSSTSMFKNGSRLNSGVMPEMSSLEKVEILKGSAAILYGNVAPGGIINMVTKQPKFATGGEVYLRSGSNNLIKPGFDIYGPISKNVAFRLNGTYEKADSYRDLVSSERFYVNPSLLFKFSPKTEFLIEADYLKSNFTPDFGIGSLDNTIISPAPRGTFLGTPWQYNKVDQTTATATLKHNINSSWDLNTSLSYQLFNRDYYSTERIQANAIGDWKRPLNKIESVENYITAQINLTGRVKTGKFDHLLLIGIDADQYNTTTYAFNNPTVYDSINILNPDKFTPRTDIPDAIKTIKTLTPLDRQGIYIQDLISLSSKFKLLAGIRWSRQHTSGTETKFLSNDSISFEKDSEFDAFSPRVGLVYQPSKFTSVFASYSNSFSTNKGTDVYLNALAPSVIDQYEAGIKNELLQGKLNINLTFYRILNNNLAQTAEFAADGITPNVNTSIKELVGQTKSDGVELDIQTTPIKGLYLLAGYSYNNLRFTKTPDGKGNYIEGERLINTPQNTANASAFYIINKGFFKRVKLGAAFYYTGDRLGGYNNTQQQTQTYSRLIPVKGFSTSDITLGYSYKKFEILTKLSNVFNTYNYNVHENYSINPIAPRQYSATLSYKF